MKLRFLVLALVATVAGAASAHVFVPVPDRIGAPAKARGELQPMLQAVPKPTALPVRSASSAPEATRPPVPILLSHRRPAVAATGIATDTYPLARDAAPPGDMVEMTARELIEADGYKGVRLLSRGPTGVWKARALRGKVEVLVSVDSAGSVSAD